MSADYSKKGMRNELLNGVSYFMYFDRKYRNVRNDVASIEELATR